MFRVHEQRGDGGPMRWVAAHPGPVEALADYWRRCATVRTTGPGLILFRPPRGMESAIPTGVFRTRRDWWDCRETDMARARLWADDCPSDWQVDGGEVRALVKAIGFSQGEIARRLGVTDRMVRYWQSGDDARPIGWPEWAALRGLLMRELSRPNALPIRPEGCQQPDDHAEPVGSPWGMG